MTQALIVIVMIIAVGAILIAIGHFIKGWRTRLFNGAIAVVGILEAADLSFLPHDYSGPIMIGIAIVGLWLRQVTTTPAGQG